MFVGWIEWILSVPHPRPLACHLQRHLVRCRRPEQPFNHIACQNKFVSADRTNTPTSTTEWKTRRHSRLRSASPPNIIKIIIIEPVFEEILFSQLCLRCLFSPFTRMIHLPCRVKSEFILNLTELPFTIHINERLSSAWCWSAYGQ